MRKHPKKVEYDDTGIVKRRDIYGMIAIIFSTIIILLVFIINILIFSHL
ncbi:MAG: hypothetical protein K5900_09890 [Butyrivibrio sp.]|nr:hypothetical protein [Butyrivibrio sp.]